MWRILVYITWSPVSNHLKCLLSHHQQVIEDYINRLISLLLKFPTGSSLDPAWARDYSNCLLNSYISTNLPNLLLKLFCSQRILMQEHSQLNYELYEKLLLHVCIESAVNCAVHHLTNHIHYAIHDALAFLPFSMLKSPLQFSASHNNCDSEKQNHLYPCSHFCVSS